MASRALARVGFADPILAESTAQTRTPGPRAFEGMSHATFGCMQAESPLGQPRLEPLLTVRQYLAFCVEHHPSIGIGDDTGVWRDAGDGLLPPMQRAQRQER